MSALVRVYVWEVPVRVTHWLIVLSIAVLSVTGFYIGYPFVTVSGPAGRHFVMGWTKVIHMWAAWVFLGAVFVRIIWMFTGNKYAHWDKFIPVHRSRLRGCWPTIKFYLFALRKPPGFVGHNPVAGATYVLVFGLYFVAIATGLVLRGASAEVESPLRWFASWAPLFGGLQIARWIHHALLWLLVGFAVHHVYSSVLMSTIEANGTIESIFSGYKFVPPEDLQYSGYRFIDRKGQVDE
ncbi:MAG: Ni/Fe-hydrogenase, b-type cytochrome subunit [Acidobacteria bacterium RIFCSPLOWO2_02_FULL_68_18]|nr:MAG: Ni/Fe-hydrogenase, b-type cytochrome subunit [Acidobacteria bacterium RIFCSPLOWO2_02_FULL_68_18]OFW48680.1 MAG: Ni/Fe-hydrogenase, b-type cytochrome subunit [Acidobacteria bacterium RIFCSPLOWO2_12_FULL_68_19]